MNSTWWYEYVLRLRRDATVYLKYKKIVIWQIKVFFKFLGVIKINFILLVQPSILQPYILQNISFPRIFSLKKGATLCAFCCWMKSPSMRRRRILMMRHSRNISPTAKYTAVVLESYSLNLSVFSACRFAFVIQNCKCVGNIVCLYFGYKYHEDFQYLWKKSRHIRTSCIHKGVLHTWIHQFLFFVKIPKGFSCFLQSQISWPESIRD